MQRHPSRSEDFPALKIIKKGCKFVGHMSKLQIVNFVNFPFIRRGSLHDIVRTKGQTAGPHVEHVNLGDALRHFFFIFSEKSPRRSLKIFFLTL